MQLFTVGYEGLSVPDLFDLLRVNHIQVLVDIRELPLSRKPGFSKTALSLGAQENGFQYLHMASLGCPREIRTAYRADQNAERYAHRFLAYLDTQHEGVLKLAALAQAEVCCLLCFETDHRGCHRTFVAGRVLSAAQVPLEVLHLAARSAGR